jgi:signal transduction histidine kinase
MVELHGGKIWAESEGEGTGTRAFFFMPTMPPNMNDVSRRVNAGK